MIYYKKKSWQKKIFSKICQIKFPNFGNFSFGAIKIVGIFFLFTIITLYSSFIFLLPKYVTSSKVENILNTYLTQNSKLQSDIINLKILPSYNLNINLKSDKITLLYPSGKDFLTLEDVDISIKPTTLIFKYIDLNKIKAKKITINTTFTKKNTYDCFECFDFSSLNFKNNTDFEIRNIKAQCEDFLLKIYDENTNTSYFTKAKDNVLTLGRMDKPVRIISNGIISSANHKIMDFNLKLEFPLTQEIINEFEKLAENLNFNPLGEANKFEFYANSNIDLKIKKNDITGFVAIKDLNFTIDDIKIPKNNMEFIFKGNKINADCDFKLIKDQFIKLKLCLNHSKNKLVELNLQTNTIKLEDLKKIATSLSKIFNSKFDLNSIVLKGTLSADMYLKSDLKTITSKGNAQIKDAYLFDNKTGLCLNNIKSLIDFQNNKINIKESSALVGIKDKSKFHLSGIVDEKANLNLKIHSDTINIAQIITLIQSIPLANKMLPKLDDYIIKNGQVTIKADINGNAKNPVITTNSLLENFEIFIKPYSAKLSAKSSQILANPKSNGSIDEIKIISK
ncbi:hypothetical protein IJ670_08680, partial [bacterium]|nr:hypothetical protein [bacterium]